MPAQKMSNPYSIHKILCAIGKTVSMLVLVPDNQVVAKDFKSEQRLVYIAQPDNTSHAQPLRRADASHATQYFM